MKEKFPVYPVEGMSYFLNKLRSKIMTESINGVVHISPRDSSLTIKEVDNGAHQYLVLFLNNQAIASTLSRITSINLGKLDELLKGDQGIGKNFNLQKRRFHYFIPQEVDSNTQSMEPEYCGFKK